MIDPFPDEWELVSFFEGEPGDSETDIPVAFRDRTYKTSLSDAEWITCGINRADESVLLEWHRDGTTALSLELHWVTELLFRTEKGQETLVFRFKDPNLEQLSIRVRPRVSVSWGIKMYP